MRKILLGISALFLFACDTNKNEIDDSMFIAETVATLEYTLIEDYDTNDIVHKLKYEFDEEGTVISEDFTNFANPQFNYTSFFDYNDDGRVTKEIRNGQLFKFILWTNNVAKVFDNQNQKLSEFTFVGDKLAKYKTDFDLNNVRIRKLNYDSNNNIVSIENETEVFVEFLDYDTSKTYPLNLIRSIGILRINSKPFFKNIFGTEKAYPYEGDDFSFPLTFFNYYYTFDSENRVHQIEDDKSVIYIQEFIYQ